MPPDLDPARRRLEDLTGHSKGGELANEARLTAMVAELKAAGWIDAVIERDGDGAAFGAVVFCVTRDGQRFLEAATRPERWAAAKENCRGGDLRSVAAALGVS